MTDLLKKLSFLFFTLSFISIPLFSDAYVNVKGHYRNGTWIAPHVRSNPNGLRYDNYSYTPSQGLYNKTYGTRDSAWDTPTYITDADYYTGQQIYNSKNSLPRTLTCDSDEVKYQNRCVNHYTYCSLSYGENYFYDKPTNSCVTCSNGYKYDFSTNQCKTQYLLDIEKTRVLQEQMNERLKRKGLIQ